MISPEEFGDTLYIPTHGRRLPVKNNEVRERNFLQMMRQMQRRFDELSLPLRSRTFLGCEYKIKPKSNNDNYSGGGDGGGVKRAARIPELSAFRSDPKIKNVTNLSGAAADLEEAAESRFVFLKN